MSETVNKAGRPAVSVIVAVFNAEKTLDRLCQSLVSQTMTDFEVLLIDDGSTDASGAVCDKYAGLDSRFKTFHKSNEGIGSTRQFGIDHAAGEYTIHADSDDWVEPDWLEQLYSKAIETGVDMVICDILEERGDTTVYSKQEFTLSDNNSISPIDLFRIQGGPCNKLIRRSSYENNGIRYKEGLNYGEDRLFITELVLKGISVAYLPKALYHYDYTANPNSAIHDISVKQIHNREIAVEELRKLLPEEEYRAVIDCKHLEVAYVAICSGSLTKEQFMDKFAFLSRVRWKEYPYDSFSIRLILWTSLHCSYSLALAMSGIKQFKRRLIH